MKILVLSPIEPSPPNGGWALVVYNDIVHLARRGHEVFLLAISHFEDRDPADMAPYCRATYFRRKKPPRWRQLVANIGQRWPFSISRYFDDVLVSKAVELSEHERLDVVLCEDVAMGTYGPLLRDQCGVPFFIRGHNVDTQVMDRFIARQRNPISRAAASWQRSKFARYEGDILARADGCSMITESDAAECRRLFPATSPAVVGAGTDLEYFRPSTVARDPNLLVHVGSLTAFTKLDAVLWFCREVWPRILEAKPGARFRLVGQAPPERFRAFPNVEVRGRVDDVREHLAAGIAFIAPQFVGSGVRLKIINAMATGNAVVATPVACEGIPIDDGQHALVREDAVGFAEAVLQLMNDPDRGACFGQSARQLAEELYDWNRITAGLEEQLALAISRRAE